MLAAHHHRFPAGNVHMLHTFSTTQDPPSEAPAVSSHAHVVGMSLGSESVSQAVVESLGQQYWPTTIGLGG